MCLQPIDEHENSQNWSGEMAEWRALRVSFCTDYRLATLEEWIQLLYDRIILQSDNWGRQTGEPLSVRLRCLPASRREPESFGEAISVLHEAGLIRWYCEEDVKVVQVIGWDEMQGKYGIKDRGKSSYPEETNDSVLLLPERTGENRRETLPTVTVTATVTDTKEHIRREREDSDLFKADALSVRSSPLTPSFKECHELFDVWKKAFFHPKAIMAKGDKRHRSILTRLKEGTTLEEMKTAIEGHAKDPWRCEEMVRHEFATLLRDRSHIEAGIVTFEQGPKKEKSDIPASKNHCGLEPYDIRNYDHSDIDEGHCEKCGFKCNWEIWGYGKGKGKDKTFRCPTDGCDCLVWIMDKEYEVDF